jgi:hypothetical protein
MLISDISTYSDVFSVAGLDGCSVENVKTALGDVLKHIKVNENKIFRVKMLKTYSFQLAH